MTGEAGNRKNSIRGLTILAMVNVGIWAISMIALVFVIQHSPSAKGLFPIMAGGTAVGISLISALSKSCKSNAG